MDFIKRFLRDEEGATATEYALLVSIIAGGIAVGAQALGPAIQGAMTDASTCITSGGATC